MPLKEEFRCHSYFVEGVYCFLAMVDNMLHAFIFLAPSLQAITAGYFYHTAHLSKGGVYKTVKHQQVQVLGLRLVLTLVPKKSGRSPVMS